MSSKKILAVGLSLPSKDVEFVSFASKTSLLDWDIVLIRPSISEFLSYADQYQGKPSLTDSSSFLLRECCAHWSREIKLALDLGKTIVVYLPPLQEVYIDSGERTYSGTGRNRQTTRHVMLYNNYNAIPRKLGVVATSGSSMKLAHLGSEILAPYWGEFGSKSNYNVLLTDSNIPASLVTKAGDIPVGAMYRSEKSAGSLLLLPDMKFSDESFTETRADGDYWTAAASQFSKKLFSSLVALDKALRSSSEVTPEPSWATDPKFTLPQEKVLRLSLLEAEAKLEQAQKEKDDVADSLASAGRLRALLFEKGKALEHAIIEALQLMGFSAAPFKQSDSEFDVVFSCDDGRFIGEAEGKDSKAINVDKLRQLSMNIHEDLQRDEVSMPAKAVLFGNAFRLQPLEERGNPFTDKCQIAASSSNTALLFTPDLYPIVQYLSDSSDSNYALQCRLVILNSVGRVTFPPPPHLDAQPSIVESTVDKEG